ncbi:MarR family winged helix-turn-helix transcriptional regulator [Actibacterium sp. D379-3]
MTETDDPQRLERQICFPLYAASHLLTRKYRAALGPLGLTYPQYLVLMALWESAPRSVGALGQALHLDSGTLTPLLKRLEAAGLVRRLRDDADQRRVLVALTAEGHAMKDRARDVPDILRGHLKDMPAQDIERLRGLLYEVMAQLSDDPPPQ